MNLFAPVVVWGFWGLVIVGYLLDELPFKGAAILILLWFAGFFGSRFGAFEMLLTPYAAALDIALVFIVFKGDVELK